VFYFYKYIIKKGTIINDCQTTTTTTTKLSTSIISQISNNSNYIEQATFQLINLANQISNYVYFLNLS
jgi:hypothetical protein